jgi:hypothetical protein
MASSRLIRRRVALGLPLILLAASSTAWPIQVLADTTPPTATKMVLHDNFTGANYDPPGGVSIPSADSFTMAGTSYSTNTTNTIRAVVAGIQNLDTLAWLQGDGSWTAGYKRFTISVSKLSCSMQILNGVSTQVCSWSWAPPTQPYPAGSYVIVAKTKDNNLPPDVELVAQNYYFSVSDSGTPGPFLTFDFGRTTWAQYLNHLCTNPLGGTLGGEYTLQQIADQMKTINPNYPALFGVGNVIINRTLTTGQECADSIAYPNWSQLANLRSTDGWMFVSAGMVYNNLLLYQSNPTQPIPDIAKNQFPAITPAPDMQTEICGSATALATNGYPEGKGMFAYPNNGASNATSPDLLQTNYTINCFRWGRRYSPVQQTYGIQVPSGPTSKPKNDNPPAAPLWYSRTISINGGTCWDEQVDVPGVPNGSGVRCTGRPTTASATYQSVPELLNMVQSMSAGHWVQLQFYRLVWGSNIGGLGAQWDCTSSDWAQHWTSSAELYCYNDFQTVIAAIPPGVTIADPQTVATAFGRTTP